MNTLVMINFMIALLFFLCYLYQFIYSPISWHKKLPEHRKTVPHRYAVLISARNEAAVIGQLIESVRRQTYDQRLITTFVIADNCTDETARIAREAGAVVYERENDQLIGKGYALDELMRHIEEDYPDKPFDAFLVLDADNVLDCHYLEEMNKTFSDGYRVITSYRNSKNYGDNWISAGYSLWFLREAKYLNNARMAMGVSCAVSGTGFLFSREIIEKSGGWRFYLLTEDIEFTVYNVLEGEKIGYCPTAILYDEQPTDFRQSFRQRLRWAKGFLQVFRSYGRQLVKSTLRGCFSAYDMTMTTMPAMLLTLSGLFMNLIACAVGLATKDMKLAETALIILGDYLLSTYLTAFIVGLITTITEWKQIYTSARKKILYLFTFPLFMLTYVPIAFVALYKKVSWQPIIHKEAKSVDDICSERHAA